jgi:hypothetical protein
MAFTPFDDTQTPRRDPESTADGYDTSAIDFYRQGVEISTNRVRFLGAQPKIWSGEIDGSTNITTYGQFVGYVDCDANGLSGKFEDLPKFNPVAFISQGDSYPGPIELNDGTPQSTDAVMEPLTIPYRKPANEGPYYAHGVHGTLEDGNDFDSYVVRGSSRVRQFYDILPAPTSRPFLDEGGDSFGGIRRDPFISPVSRELIPFDDALTLSFDKQLQTSSSTFLTAARNGIEIGEESLLPYGQKSAPAGSLYYGLRSAEFGTDSITFGGWARGS